ncbi:MAG TPA: hypothetical protein VFK57_09180 [Vicinamibacterales bacterium]|nr:hypothetical protein [Vicinamibacterales bacterium]
MDVFLIPVGAERYELYCEEPDEPEEAAADQAPGFFRRTWLRIRQQLDEAERARDRDHGAAPHEDAPAGFLARLKARTLRWAAGWIAEQRLLWQLRGKDAACLVHPEDVPEPQARELLKRSLQRDWERHRFWLVIDSIGLIGSAALVLVPGPNVLGYYFLVRTVGHYFSLRGARQGLACVTWSVRADPDLAALRGMADEPPDDREDRVRAIGERLGLERFARFFQRSAIK